MATVDRLPLHYETSVVIPTTGRTSLAAAIGSVLRQTLPPKEVLVCNNGSSPLRLPPSLPDAVRVIEVGAGAGGNVARDRGLQHATGNVCALLDDDDEWEPRMLERVLGAVHAASPDGPWIASARAMLDNGKVYPGRLALNEEDLPSYLFRTRGFGDKGAIPTSCMVFSSELAGVSWRAEQRFHQDLTWLLDVWQRFPKVRVIQVAEALVRLRDTPGSISKRIHIDASVDWAQRELLGLAHSEPRRLYSDFLMTRYPMRAASKSGHIGDVRSVWMHAARSGALGLPAIVYGAAYSAAALGSALRRNGAVANRWIR